jgi:hypothetical protein
MEGLLIYESSPHSICRYGRGTSASIEESQTTELMKSGLPHHPDPYAHDPCNSRVN